MSYCSSTAESINNLKCGQGLIIDLDGVSNLVVNQKTISLYDALPEMSYVPFFFTFAFQKKILD